MIRRSTVPFIIIGIVTFALVAWYARTSWLQLGNPAIVTGYTLLTLMLRATLSFFLKTWPRQQQGIK